VGIQVFFDMDKKQWPFVSLVLIFTEKSPGLISSPNGETLRERVIYVRENYTLLKF
jgi:hypothetical protein